MEIEGGEGMHAAVFVAGLAFFMFVVAAPAR